jgi:hypothetical protein
VSCLTGLGDNIATRLDNAGYRTALLGKYLNSYRGTSVPLGWDCWFATFDPDSQGTQPGYFDYDVNANGSIRRVGARERVTARPTCFAGRLGNSSTPAFAWASRSPLTSLS